MTTDTDFKCPECRSYSYCREHRVSTIANVRYNGYDCDGFKPNEEENELETLQEFAEITKEALEGFCHNKICDKDCNGCHFKELKHFTKEENL